MRLGEGIEGSRSHGYWRRIPGWGGALKRHSFTGFLLVGKCKHTEVQVSLFGSLTSLSVGTECPTRMPASSHCSWRVLIPPCLSPFPQPSPQMLIFVLRSNGGHSLCLPPWPLPRGGNEGPGAGVGFLETTHIGERGLEKLWRPSCSRSRTTFATWAAASRPRTPEGGGHTCLGLAAGEPSPLPWLYTKVCPQQKAAPGCSRLRKPQGILWCPQSFRGWRWGPGWAPWRSAQVPGTQVLGLRFGVHTLTTSECAGQGLASGGIKSSPARDWGAGRLAPALTLPQGLSALHRTFPSLGLPLLL